MRNVPGLIRAVTAKAAAQLIVDTALRHFLQSCVAIRNVSPLPVGKIPAQAEFQFRWMKEFWRIAKSPIHRDRIGSSARQALSFNGLVESSGDAGLFGRQHVGERFQQRNALPLDFGPSRVISFRNSRQQIEKAWQTMARCFRKIRPAEEWLLIRSQKQGQRPAAGALGEHVECRLIDLVEIGAFFAIHLDIDEMLVHHRGNFRIFETLVRHDVAPVAGRVTDGKQNRLILRAGKVSASSPQGYQSTGLSACWSR